MPRFILTFCISFAASYVCALQVQLTVVNSTCGNNNGSIFATVVGGSGALSYTWTPVPPTGNGTPTIIELAPGTWSVTVFDSDGNSGTASATIIDMPNLDVPNAILGSTFLAACPGQCTAQLYLTENLLGGEGPYTVNTTPSMPLNGICGDTPFVLQVTDALGCIGMGTALIPEIQPVNMLGSLVQGPCGGAPTSITFYFDGPFPTGGMWSAPGGNAFPMIGSVVGNSLVVTPPINPGVYVYSAFMPPPCPVQLYTMLIPATVTDCASVEGDLYVDINGDCTFDGTDYRLPNKVVTLQPSGMVALTDVFGHYRFQVPYGTYDLSYTDPNYAQNCAVASPVNFTLDAGTPSTTINLALTSGDPDVSIVCATGQAVPGFKQSHWLTVTNNSAIPSGPLTVTLGHDPVLTWSPVYYCGGSGPVFADIGGYWGSPDFWVPGQAQWNLSNGLEPGAQAFLRVDLQVPPDVALIGTTLNSTATVTTTLNDIDLGNNVCNHGEVVVGSFDPNDKQARTTSGSGESWIPAVDSSITYTLRFQNTGTAPAHTVVVSDTLPTQLELSSLKVLGASHTYTTSLDSARVLRFIFPSIMLPDSNANETGSHGFAQFSIRPRFEVLVGSTIRNAADIFFDFNPPIRTNTSELFVEGTTGVPVREKNEISVFPVPASDVLLFRAGDRAIHSGSVVAMDGRVVRRFAAVHNAVNVDGLVPGTYLLSVVDEQGVTLHVPFVKE